MGTGHLSKKLSKPLGSPNVFIDRFYRSAWYLHKELMGLWTIDLWFETHQFIIHPQIDQFLIDQLYWHDCISVVLYNGQLNWIHNLHKLYGQVKIMQVGVHMYGCMYQLKEDHTFRVLGFPKLPKRKNLANRIVHIMFLSLKSKPKCKLLVWNPKLAQNYPVIVNLTYSSCPYLFVHPT